MTPTALLASLSATIWLALSSFSVQAASVAYFLDQSNDMPNGVNYLKVTVSDSLANLGDIDFRVDVLTANFPSPGSNFGMQAFSFNYDTSFNVTPTNIVNIDPSTWTISQDANAGGGFGRFEFQLSGTGSSRAELMTFSITGVNGDTPSTYAMGSTLNPVAVEFFAAHVAGYDAGNGVTSAQFAGSKPVPVPAALWLLGSGLLGLVGWVRRRN